MVISEHIRSGINLCLLHASLKTAAHLSTYTATQKHNIYWKWVRKRTFKKKKREGQTKPSHFFSFFSSFSLFSAPSLPASFPVHLLLSTCFFHPFDRWATFVEMERIWKCVWLQDPEWAEPEGGRKTARTHERKDEKWPCRPLDLWTEERREGRQNESAGTVRGRKLIPPRCCASVVGGVPGQPTGTADNMSPLTPLCGAP